MTKKSGAWLGATTRRSMRPRRRGLRSSAGGPRVGERIWANAACAGAGVVRRAVTPGGGAFDGSHRGGEFVHTRTIASLIAVVGVQVFAAVAVLVAAAAQSAHMRRVLPCVNSVAVGVLLATGLAHLLPEAVNALGNRTGLWIVLVLTISRAVLHGAAVAVVVGCEWPSRRGNLVRIIPMKTTSRAREIIITMAWGGQASDATDGRVLRIAWWMGRALTTAFAIDRTVGMDHGAGDWAARDSAPAGGFRITCPSKCEAGDARRCWRLWAGLSSLLGWGLVVALGGFRTDIGWLGCCLSVPAASCIFRWWT